MLHAFWKCVFEFFSTLGGASKEIARQSWITLTTLYKETAKKCVQMKLSRSCYETQLNQVKEVQETSIRALSREFRVSEHPRTWIQMQACQQKTNIMSGCPQHLGIQKEVGWNLVLHLEMSAGSWVRLSAHSKREEMNSRRKRLGEAVCTSEENWEEFHEASKLWRAQSFLFRVFPSPDSSTHLALLFQTKSFENSVTESWGSRSTSTWECHEFCAREANVLS